MQVGWTVKWEEKSLQGNEQSIQERGVNRRQRGGGWGWTVDTGGSGQSLLRTDHQSREDGRTVNRRLWTVNTRGMLYTGGTDSYYG